MYGRRTSLGVIQDQRRQQSSEHVRRDQWEAASQTEPRRPGMKASPNRRRSCVFARKVLWPVVGLSASLIPAFCALAAWKMPPGVLIAERPLVAACLFFGGYSTPQNLSEGPSRPSCEVVFLPSSLNAPFDCGGDQALSLQYGFRGLELACWLT